MQDGCLVRLVSPEARKRFGDEIYTVVRVRRDLNAVEINELGNVAISDVMEVDEEGNPIDETVTVASSSHTSNLLGELPDNLRRIEAIAGTLLNHSDSNVRMAMREVLGLLWERS